MESQAYCGSLLSGNLYYYWKIVCLNCFVGGKDSLD